MPWGFHDVGFEWSASGCRTQTAGTRCGSTSCGRRVARCRRTGGSTMSRLSIWSLSSVVVGTRPRSGMTPLSRFHPARLAPMSGRKLLPARTPLSRATCRRGLGSLHRNHHKIPIKTLHTSYQATDPTDCLNRLCRPPGCVWRWLLSLLHTDPTAQAARAGYG